MSGDGLKYGDNNKNCKLAGANSNPNVLKSCLIKLSFTFVNLHQYQSFFLLDPDILKINYC